MNMLACDMFRTLSSTRHGDRIYPHILRSLAKCTQAAAVGVWSKGNWRLAALPRFGDEMYGAFGYLVSSIHGDEM